MRFLLVVRNLRIFSLRQRFLLDLLLEVRVLLTAKMVPKSVLLLGAMQRFFPLPQVLQESDVEGLLELKPSLNLYGLIHPSPIRRNDEARMSQAKMPSIRIQSNGSFNPSVVENHSASRILCPVLRNLMKMREPHALHVIAGCHFPSRSRVKL